MVDTYLKDKISCASCCQVVGATRAGMSPIWVWCNLTRQNPSKRITNNLGAMLVGQSGYSNVMNCRSQDQCLAAHLGICEHKTRHGFSNLLFATHRQRHVDEPMVGSRRCNGESQTLRAMFCQVAAGLDLMQSMQFVAYCIGKAIYNAHFHPLAKYPGPKLAAISDIWWAYSRYSL